MWSYCIITNSFFYHRCHSGCDNLSCSYCSVLKSLWQISRIIWYRKLNSNTSQLLIEVKKNRTNNIAKIALIVGSVRRDRQGIKVARWIEEKLKNRNHVVFLLIL